jgi:hypothetical protein
MKNRKRSKHRFVVGEEVVAYREQGFSYGKVVSVDGDKVVVAVMAPVYKDGKPVTEPREYTRRSKDGLYVHADSADQPIPDQMISALDEFSYMFKGRYGSGSSFAFRVAQVRLFIQWVFENALFQHLDRLEKKQERKNWK